MNSLLFFDAMVTTKINGHSPRAWPRSPERRFTMDSIITTFSMLAALIAVAGCGKSDPPRPALPPKAAAAAKVAALPSDGLPPPDCPVKVDAALPGPDVVGLKLGMPREDALNFARCLNTDAFVSFEGAWIQGLRTYGIKLAPQAFATYVGQTRPCKYNSIDEMDKCGVGNRAWTHVAEKITVVSPGVPGREKVMGIWREQHFKAGEMPTAEALLPALVKKYGQPQLTQQHPNNWVRLDWMQDASGTPLVQGQRGAGQCRSISARGNESHSWSDACGLTITALIVLSPENPLLAKELNIGMVQQQELYRVGASLQADLQAMEQLRLRQEADHGKSAADNVKL